MLSQSEQETTTVRIVFDGPPFAGKTTAAYSLGEALGGTTETPSEEEGRTVWFDWMTYTGGRHEGKAIRVELVTVPGQDALADRRKHLIGWGDVVVFIADTSAAAFDATVAKFRELEADLVATAKEAKPVIVANKRDLDDALPLEEVRDRLGLDESTDVVEAIATDGGGLRQAFIYAVRSALAAKVNGPASTTPDQLLIEMKERLGTKGGVVSPAELQAFAAASDEPVSELDDDMASAVDVRPLSEDEVVPVEVPVAQSAPGTVKASDVDLASVTALVDVSLARDALTADRSMVLLAEHWRLIVAISNGQTALPLDGGSDLSVLASELLAWGLVKGVIRQPDSEPAPEPSGGPEPHVPELAPEPPRVGPEAAVAVDRSFGAQPPLTPEPAFAEMAPAVLESPVTSELVAGSESPVTSELVAGSESPVTSELLAGSESPAAPEPAVSEPAVSQPAAVPPAPAGRTNERYRALRELRRTLRRH